jgi:RNA polymerase sigma factor (sigma-70 family)
MRADIKHSTHQEIGLVKRSYFENEFNSRYFDHFKQGRENGLSCLYQTFYKHLLRHGLRIIADEFVINSSIQEAFLKAWNFRERMASVLHTYRFLRLNVTWKCYDYYRHPNQLHQRIIYTDNIDNYTKGCYFDDKEHEGQVFAISEERLQAIDKVIPYLPATRKTIFTLYFKYGLTHRQIAKRFSSSSQFISAELQKGLEDLKKVIHTAKKLDTPVIPHHTDTRYPACLQGELLQLFRLRYESKWSFEKIAAQMNLPLAYVQHEYIKAHRLINEMRKSGR